LIAKVSEAIGRSHLSLLCICWVIAGNSLSVFDTLKRRMWMTISLQWEMTISATLFATCTLSMAKDVGADSSEPLLLRLFVGVTRESTGPDSGLVVAIVYEFIRSPTSNGPKTIPNASYPMKSEVGRGLSRSTSPEALSASRPIRLRRPKTAHINSLRY